MIGTIFPELGYYALPGHVSDPGGMREDVERGEALGFGSVWISERLNTKNIGLLSGYAAAVTQRMGIAAGLISNLPLRHPLTIASYTATMAKLTDGRFALGIGRGVERLADASGTPRVTLRIIEDYLLIMRRLWRGETVDYEGPLGRISDLTLGAELDSPPPVILAAMGDKTCYWAGQHCDGVVFNSLWSARAVAHSAEIVRRGAVDAGRDPASIRIWTILMTACEAPESVYLEEIIRRMNTYVLFPQMFDDICAANGWDKAIAQTIRSRLNEIDGQRKPGLVGDENTARDADTVRCMAELYPASWIGDGCAVGAAADCAESLRDRFDAGADGVVLHGSRAEFLGPLLARWPDYRPRSLNGAASVNPGLGAGR